MSEITTTVIELPELRNRIKAEDSKARNIAKKSLAHVIECGLLLIELKARVNHGHWKYEARQLNMSPRTISNYMKIARNGNVAVLGKGVRDALRLLSIAENPPPANPTAPALPEPPAPSPRLPQITLDAEIVEPAQLVDDAPPIPEPGVALVYARTASDALNKIPKRDPSRKAAIQMISDWVNQATSSPAPSLIETSETTLTEVLALLPRLRPEEIAELHRVLESRWMKGGRP